MTKNYKNAQEYLNSLYTFKDKKEIKSISLEDQELEGSLNFSEFPNLELLSLKNNQISEVEVSNCPKLKHLDLTQNNNLTKLTVYDLNSFERLIADTGTLKKSSFFGGESEWEPQNIGNSNIAPLKIIKTKIKGPKNPSEGILKALVLNFISVISILENNPQYAGIIENTNWFGQKNIVKLNYQEFNQLKKDIIHKIIAKKPSEWEIREEKISDWNNLTDKKLTLLVHKPFELQRNSEGTIEIECGKVHFKKGFTEKEWKEIEGILGNKQKKTELEETKPKWYQKPTNYFWGIAIIVGIFALLFLVKKILGIQKS